MVDNLAMAAVTTTGVTATMAATTVESAATMTAATVVTTTAMATATVVTATAAGSAMEATTVVAIAVKASRTMVVTAVRAIGVASAATAVEAMTAPAVAVAPVGPGTYAEEEAVVEVARTIPSVWCTGVGSVVVVAPLADGGAAYLNANRAADANTNADLRASCCRRDRQAR